MFDRRRPCTIFLHFGSTIRHVYSVGLLSSRGSRCILEHGQKQEKRETIRRLCRIPKGRFQNTTLLRCDEQEARRRILKARADTSITSALPERRWRAGRRPRPTSVIARLEFSEVCKAACTPQGEDRQIACCMDPRQLLRLLRTSLQPCWTRLGWIGAGRREIRGFESCARSCWARYRRSGNSEIGRTGAIVI